VLQVKDLSVRYGQARALSGVNLEVRQGEIVAVIGRNGAGKTTLLRALSGLVHPASGEIRFDGRDITRLPPEAIVRLGLVHVPQGRLIFPDQTVLDNLILGAYTLRDRSRLQRNVEREFQRFPRLAERRRQLAGTLSGGEQQMLAIARGLMTDPRFLALDEPSLGLAPVMVGQILEVIVGLKAQGITVLLVEQLAHAALEIADRAYLLHTGEVRITGGGTELLDHPDVIRQYLGGTV
jgi:branched-chain amino acid transport system ATP-binding protein